VSRGTVAPRRVSLLGCEIDASGMDDTVLRCEEIIDSDGRAHHMSVNAAKIVALHRDEKLRAIIQGCELVNADGQSVVWASRLLGSPLPERVAGIDLMFRLLELAEHKGYRIYFLGARPDVLERALKRLRSLHPRLQVAGYHDGYFGDDQEKEICAEIRTSKPQILFVAMSSPRKEFWTGRHRAHLDVPLVVGVGGSLDVVAGVTRRAPPWMQRAGVEWLFRLLQEPRRLVRRYATTNVRFLVLVARELRTSGRERR
jgi:N-acetylglucosaminyldiphosphoundecaprenol N-acetyl-beta-D-mannosaminyltransferase